LSLTINVRSPTPLAQPQEKVAPARAAFAIGQIDSQNLPPAFPVHGNRNQHRLADDDAAFADPLITGIQNEIRVGLLKAPLGKRLRLSFRLLLMALIEDAEKLCPHNASVTALIFRVDTPCTYISASVPTKAFSER
jgi:hypothetical protein